MSFIKENHKDKKILMIFSCLQIKIVIVKHKKWPLKSIAIKSVFLMDSPSPLNWIFYILKYNIPVILYYTPYKYHFKLILPCAHRACI